MKDVGRPHLAVADGRDLRRTARRGLLAAAMLAVLAVVLAVLPPYPLIVWAFLAGAVATVVAVGVGVWSLLRDGA